MEPQDSKRSACPTNRIAWLIAILIALLHAFMAVTAVNTKSPTFDEPQHLTAGYSYWVTNDFRLDPENGNLPARWAALPLLFEDTKFISLNDHGWQRAEEGRTAHEFFYEVGNDPDQMLRQARTMMSIFGAALCLLIYRIGREFFGITGGLIAATVFAFDPNFLAHSALVTADVPAAFFFTATIWSCWRLFQKITPVRLLIAAFSLSALFLTKFSAPIVLPILVAMSILKIVSQSEIKLHFGKIRIALSDSWKKSYALAACWIVLGAILFVAIWGSCSFRYAAWTDNRAAHEGTVWHWNYLLENSSGPVLSAVKVARDHHFLPEQYLYGLAYVRKHEVDRPAFLDNRWSVIGFRSFFPLAFIYKTPLPFLLLLGLALYAAIANRHSWKIKNVFNPLWGFAILYSAFALTAQLNIGHRHLLPIYPALFVACGAVIHLLQQNRQRVFAGAIAILLASQIAESFATRPNYLAYFNQIAGGPSHGYQHLVDSSLDWGQDLPALKSWIDNHRAFSDSKPIYLGYFGTADPRWYEINAELILPENQFAEPPLKLTSGIYCLSATTLQSVYLLEMGPWCAAYERRYRTVLAGIGRGAAKTGPVGVAQIANDRQTPSAKDTNEFERLRFGRLCAFLRHRQPIAQIGYSIFLFDLDENDIARAVYGPPAELAPEFAVRGY